MNPKDYPVRDFQWSQRDWRWRWKKLGRSGLTVGGYGCASLCITYILDRFFKETGQRWLYPSEVVDSATYTPDGRLYWNTVDKLSHGALKHVYYRGRYVLKEVYWSTYRHWVVKLGKEEDNLCYDPWSGRIENFSRPEWIPTGREIYFD